MKKVIIAVVVLLAVSGIVVAMVAKGHSAATKVVTGKVMRQDLVAVVSGTGQIKPKTYANIGAETIGRITHLYVKEGDHVKEGQVLDSLENVQPAADVQTQNATIASSRTDLTGYEAAQQTADANLASAKATLEQKKLDWQRGQELYKEQLIPKSDYDTRKAAYDVAVAAIAQNQASIAQASANTASAKSRINQNVATLGRYKNALDHTINKAPFDGIITNLPVREGETVVVGIQNAGGSTLMTIADMSVVTAEVKVDETDIVNVALGQPADVTVDALPGKSFKGHVTLVGDQAILRSTGIATSQSTTGAEEAKDFKVVVTLDQPSDDLRPGLSTTAKITTAHKTNVITLPLQALTMRNPSDIAAQNAVASGKSAPPPPSADVPTAKQPDEQGVFVLHDVKGKQDAVFTPVTTGTTGTTDIEVLSGVQPGDQIVTGTFRVLRNLKSGTPVKPVDAMELAKEEAS